MSETTTTRVEEQLEKFVDATPNEVYARGRLVTRETENRVQLIGYGNHILAEVDRGANVVMIYDGHQGASPTVDRYLSQLKDIAEERSVMVQVLSAMEPSLGRKFLREAPNQYIEHYVSSFKEASSVEREAINDVEESCKKLAKWLLE